MTRAIDPNNPNDGQILLHRMVSHLIGRCCRHRGRPWPPHGLVTISVPKIVLGS